MFIYIMLQAIAGVVAAIIITKRNPKPEDRIYGKLDRVGIVTNVLLAILYVIATPICFILGAISAPQAEGFWMLLAVPVALIAASVSFFSSLGIGYSVVLRRKGRSGLSFAAQFAGVLSILLMLVLYECFSGTLLRTLN